MQTVNVRKQDLLETLKRNRAIHEKKFKDAIEGYRLVAIERLEALLEAIKAGGDVETEVDMPDLKPESHVVDYDMAIMMVGMSVDDVIELRDFEFKQYVMDEWSWSRSFSSSSSSYSSVSSSW